MLEGEKSEMRQSYPWNAIVAEAVGTFLFLMVGIGAASMFGQFDGANLVSVALAHGIALAVMVSAFGAISGGHFNPAVTWALWLTGKSDGRRSVAYILAQLIGAVAAAVLVRYVTPPEISEIAVLPAPNAALGVDAIKAVVIEAALTMVLLAAVFGTAVDPRAPKIGGIAIGIAIAADIMFGGPLTGAAMNPARWFGPAVVAGDFTNVIIYTLGPVIGATIIALVYRYLFLPEANAQTGANV
jgi:aquaporin Z